MVRKLKIRLGGSASCIQSGMSCAPGRAVSVHVAVRATFSKVFNFVESEFLFLKSTKLGCTEEGSKTDGGRSRSSPVFFDRQHILVHTEHSVPSDKLLLFIPVVKTNLMARQAVSCSVKSGLGLRIRTRGTVPFHTDKPRYKNRDGRVNVQYQIPGPGDSKLKITFPRPPSKGHCVRSIVVTWIFYKVAFKGCFGPCLPVQKIV
ncbi:hypothetical protein E4T38_03711 [Aureobasidium subglaciale]|nr:hypothetical protein E4T38_03711 [Aureobasidium subglaciale]KAI5224935.1 hypothetical protein E4T41_05459 [Aureobasidium subglaciale]KAI5225414.1 hypothetical protein E4T40_03486 [Aureobasidium subglaciale]KAI5261141.1 hypothetical protein E4T46_05352 [Aureobasidium subglaciale]